MKYAEQRNQYVNSIINNLNIIIILIEKKIIFIRVYING